MGRDAITACSEHCPGESLTTVLCLCFKCRPYDAVNSTFQCPFQILLFEICTFTLYFLRFLSGVRSHTILRLCVCIFRHSIKLFPSSIVNACCAPFLGSLLLLLFAAVCLLSWLPVAFRSLQASTKPSSARCRTSVPSGMGWVRGRKALLCGSGNVLCPVLTLTL